MRYHEIKEHAGRDFPLIFTPALFLLISARFLFTGMRIWRLLRVKKGRGMVTVDIWSPMKQGLGGRGGVPGQLHGISQCGSEAMEYENIIFLPSMLMSAESDLCTYDFFGP